MEALEAHSVFGGVETRMSQVEAPTRVIYACEIGHAQRAARNLFLAVVDWSCPQSLNQWSSDERGDKSKRLASIARIEHENHGGSTGIAGSIMR